MPAQKERPHLVHHVVTVILLVSSHAEEPNQRIMVFTVHARALLEGNVAAMTLLTRLEAF